MKKIETKFFGVQEVDETNFVTFNHGLPGFENTRQYLISRYSEDSPFYVMQSVEKVDLAFILIGFEQVVPDYSFDLSEEAVTDLKLTQPEETVVYLIVTIPGELENATVNLAAPVVINSKELLGKQIIFNHPAYSLKHPLFGAKKNLTTEGAASR
ncbi:MAG TPA: flagellar assembly protein FliW [Bacillota bacterium]|nr:flagellar assembly protein FliW [Bacillota bacterium]